MKKHATLHSQPATVTISIPRDLQQQVDHIATQQGETFSEFICLALASYIDAYSRQPQPEKLRMSLEDARVLMRKFGHGLGTGKTPRNGSRNHDEYLSRHK